MEPELTLLEREKVFPVCWGREGTISHIPELSIHGGNVQSSKRKHWQNSFRNSLRLPDVVSCLL